MYDLPLPGISGSKPIGAMAAFGLLRIVASEAPFGETRLSWQFASDWHPVLHTEQLSSLESLTEFLIDRQPARSDAHFLNWNDDIKCDPAAFEAEVKKTVQDSLQESALFFSAFGSEAILQKNKPVVKPTGLHFTSARQQFLKLGRELSQSLNPESRSSRQSAEQRKTEILAYWHEALVGPWSYQDKVHSLGWDPSTEQLHALRAGDPSPSRAEDGTPGQPRSVRAVVWLAYESLPLFPSVPGRKQLLTTGFDHGGKSFTWPIWRCSISVNSLRHWLASADIIGDPPNIKELQARGVAALFRAQCIQDANGRGTFRNAVEMT